MKYRNKVLFAVQLLVMALLLVCQTSTAQAKSVKLTHKKLKLNLTGCDELAVSVINAIPKKVKWSVNKVGKKVIKLTNKNKKLSYVNVKAKKAGKAVLRAKITVGKKTYRRTCRVTVVKYDIAKKSLCKKEFSSQNDYRRKAGAEQIGWSDTLYDLGLYRLKTHGMDRHAYMWRDYDAFFGGNAYVSMEGDMIVSENLSTGGAKGSALLWRRSPSHYQNMIDERWKSGAIASIYGVGTIAIYSIYSPDEVPAYKSMELTNTDT